MFPPSVYLPRTRLAELVASFPPKPERNAGRGTEITLVCRIDEYLASPLFRLSVGSVEHSDGRNSIPMHLYIVR